MPRHQLGGTTQVRHSPSRPEPYRTHVTRDPLPRPAPVRRRGAGAVGVLTSALAGSGLVAGHVVLADGPVHIEDLALQAFAAPAAGTAPDDPGTAPGADPAPAQPDRRPLAPVPVAGAVAPIPDPLPQPDVGALTAAATAAVGDAVQAGRDAQARQQAAASGADRGSGGATGPRRCAAGTEGFGDVAAGTAAAGELLRCMFGVDTVHGVAGRANASDHPKGKALDFMADRATGEGLAEYARANMDELGISYVIYRQRIDTGSGWETQEDRGGATANHMDHVHISFD